MARAGTAQHLEAMTFQKTVESYRQGARTMPRERYASPEIFAQEKEKLFARHWNCIGRASQIKQPGDYIVRSVAGESLIVLRDRDGGLVQPVQSLVEAFDVLHVRRADEAAVERVCPRMVRTLNRF